MIKKITTTWIEDEKKYGVYFGSKLLGFLEKDTDGFFVFYHDSTNNGYWDSYLLTSIAEKLEEVNAEWQITLNKELDEFEKSLGQYEQR